MQFLSPWSALVVAAVALPLLLLLYFLKLKRQTLRVPSTLLWSRSFEDLQVNVPFQRLRWSALLLLQVLMLSALLLALSEPLWRGAGAADGDRLVILIDRSASMNAALTDNGDQPPRTRLDAAKDAARALVDSVGRSGGPSQAMIIAFGARANVLCAFEANRGVLRDIIDSIDPTDEQADLATALEIASAFAGRRDEGNDSDSTPTVILLSDGNVSGADQRGNFSLRAGDFRFVQVVPEPRDSVHGDNLGIVALGVRREFDDPSRVIVFARLLNSSTTALNTVVSVQVDLDPVASLIMNVPAVNDAGPGEQSLTHTLDLPEGGLVLVRHSRADRLPADDVAAIIVPPPLRPRVVIVYPRGSTPDPYLHELLQAMEPQSIQTISMDGWAAIEPAVIDDRSRYDLVVFDRVSGARLPGVPSLTFGGVPAGVGTVEPRDDFGQMILSWDRQHPVMRNLALDSIVFSGFGALRLPEVGATALAYGPEGPIMALIRTRGARHVVVGFAPGRSNWPLHVSSAMFVQNAVEYLTLASELGGAASGGLAYRPGEPIPVRAAADTQEIVVRGEGHTLRVPVVSTAGGGVSSASSQVTIPGISRAGVYSAAGALPPHGLIAVNVASDSESDIRPRESVTVNARPAEAIARGSQQSKPLWPWLLAFAFVLAVIEWLAYCKRVR